MLKEDLFLLLALTTVLMMTRLASAEGIAVNDGFILLPGGAFQMAVPTQNASVSRMKRSMK